MPMHDWRRVIPNFFHSLHTQWLVAIHDSLNDNLLSDDYYAVVEQIIENFNADVLTLTSNQRSAPESGGTAPAVKLRDQGILSNRQRRNRIVIHHNSGDVVVAVIEIVSPGNKDGKDACNSFIQKAVELISSHVSLLLIDPFAPTKRDPRGLHARIWKKLVRKANPPHSPLPQEPLMCVSYSCSIESEVFAAVERFAVGQIIPSMPLCLIDEWITIPLEETYMSVWEKVPKQIKEKYFTP